MFGRPPSILKKWFQIAAFIWEYLPCFAAAQAASPAGLAGGPWMIRYLLTTRTSLGYFSRILSTVGFTIAQYGHRNSKPSTTVTLAFLGPSLGSNGSTATAYVDAGS